MKLSKWFWGLFFIAAGGIIITGSMGYLGEVNLLSLIFTLFLIPIIFKSLLHLNFGGILFPFALIAILYDQQLGITALTPWPILAAALFLSIGLTILFHRKPKWDHHEEHFKSIVDENDPDVVEMNIQFTSSIKYVNSEDFKLGKFKCSFGAMKLYFDHAVVANEGAEIKLDISFSGVELYIPKEWTIVNKLNTSLGGVEEKNIRSSSSGPIVTLTGDVHLAGVEIIYI